METNAGRVTLAGKPDLGFAFEAIIWDDVNQMGERDGHPLSAAERGAVAAFLASHGVANNNAARLVWGVDAQGALLGLVPASRAHAVTPPQPSSASAWRWDFAAARWTSTLTPAAVVAEVTQLAEQVAAHAELLQAIPRIATTMPAPEALKPSAGKSADASASDHQHAAQGGAKYVTLDASSLGAVPFSIVFDERPVVQAEAIVPPGARPVKVEVQSFTTNAAGKFTGCVIRGYRTQPLPVLSGLLAAVIGALSSFDVFGGSAAGVTATVLYRKQDPAQP